MELLLIATYTALCWAIFKIFKIPVNKWSIPTAILGGVVMIGVILLLMSGSMTTLVRRIISRVAQNMATAVFLPVGLLGIK